MRVCEIEDCGKVAPYSDWCRMHYMRWYRWGDPNYSAYRRGNDAIGCDVVDCNNPYCAKGLCEVHYARLNRKGRLDLPTDEERFWVNVDKRTDEECWVWKLGLNDSGYGRFTAEGKRMRAHRYSALLAGMDIEGKVVMHLCDNPPCVNPAHLKPGTQAENLQDMHSKGRWQRRS